MDDPNPRGQEQTYTEPKHTPDKPCMPCGHRVNGRNLIVCIDGTSNQFGEKNTNVIELYNLILKKVDDNQRTWYNSGIGTYARPSWRSLDFYKKVLYHKIDLAIAWDFERTVLGAYRWLSDNYEQDDCIFLFGFSRGAFQVRVLSAMIDKVGLVYKGNEMQIPFAYELYADPESDIATVAAVGCSDVGPKTSMAERFKNTFSNEDVRVHFVGAWDTVSSIGIARGTCMLPRTVDGMKHVCYFRHALALDERRVKFLPEYAYGGSAKPALDGRSLPKSLSTAGEGEVNDSQVGTGSRGTQPHTKEVWFAGTHSDIGGGNVQNAELDRSRPPLRWMVFEAGAAGLRTARFKRELLVAELITIIESLTWLWWLFEICPFKRLRFARKEDGLQMTRKPHLGSGRNIHEGQKIHSSLLRANNKTVGEYTPEACPVGYESSFWKSLRRGEAPEWLEHDLYERIGNMVKTLIAVDDVNTLGSLSGIATSTEARQAVYEEVVKALGRELPLETKHRLLHHSMEVLKGTSKCGPDFQLNLSIRVRPLLSGLCNGGNEDHQRTAQRIVDQFTDPCQVIRLDNGIWSTAFFPDSTRVVSLSEDGMVQIWDAETGKPVGEPLQGRKHQVNCVAFSPDGTRIASGSGDTKIRIWDVGTGKPVGEPLQGRKHQVNCVAFSPDGTRIASGSGGTTIRIWDVGTGKAVGRSSKGHSEEVVSVAFSPDGTRIVSGSPDKTVRIWDAESQQPVGKPFRGHKHRVNCVAFSPDGTRIASGSDGKSIRIWGVGKGKVPGRLLKGHSDKVVSVAFSPDGTRIVSGSYDWTVRIWDADTGKPVGAPLEGHTSPVISVAFSSDGMRVVSGSSHGMVQIWDLGSSRYITSDSDDSDTSDDSGPDDTDPSRDSEPDDTDPSHDSEPDDSDSDSPRRVPEISYKARPRLTTTAW